jgi:hypothetical protein
LVIVQVDQNVVLMVRHFVENECLWVSATFALNCTQKFAFEKFKSLSKLVLFHFISI